MEKYFLDFGQYDNEKNNYFKEDNKLIIRAKLMVCIVAYVILLYSQKWMQVLFYNEQGVIAQFQVLLSIFLTIYLNKEGYITAVLLNTLQIAYISIYIISSHNLIAIPGVIVSLTAILIITILHRYSKNLSIKIAKIIDQKLELAMNADKINRLALYDSLTGIPNRIHVINQIELLSKTSKYNDTSYILVMFDIYNFKYINDTLGHQTGDLVLKNIVNELELDINKKDIFGRFSEDEFALVISRLISDQDLLSYIDQIKAALQRVDSINNNKINITANFGIALYPKDSEDCMELIMYADTAMNKSKENGKNNMLFFNSKMKEEVTRKIEFENQLLSCLEKEELYLVFQPQYHSKNKLLRGYEALARWNSTVNGEVSPMQFIPIAEENGFIIPMGKWILNEACRLLQEYLKTTGLMANISVNISAKQIMDPEFVDTVRNALEQSGLPPQCLELEITESILIDEVDYVCGILKILRGMGVRIALDDFGMGYSSLGLLQKLPIDTLKIDKSFIQDIDKEDKTNHLVDAIISLGQKMNFFIIAEGIETEKQLEQLKTYHCDCIQGFLWGKPEKFLAAIEEYKVIA